MTRPNRGEEYPKDIEELEGRNKDEEDYNLPASAPTGRRWPSGEETRADGGTIITEGEETDTYDLRDFLDDLQNFYRREDISIEQNHEPGSEKVKYGEAIPEEGLTARDARLYLEEGFNSSYREIPDSELTELDISLQEAVENTSAEKIETLLDRAVDEERKESVNIDMGERKPSYHNVTFYTL